MKGFFQITLFFSLIILFICQEKDRSREEWKKRSIYQLMTDRFATSKEEKPCNVTVNNYCGGDHKGLQNKLDYIQGMGFDAIWISPVVKNAEGSYHSYHTVDFYGLNEHFGTKQELHDLINECHKRDIYVMLDVVANHVALVGNDFSTIKPFNSPEHYHEPCTITDWDNYVMVENCRLADLPDLKHENNWVSDELIRWIKYMVKEYDLDGLRVDTVPEVPKWFWKRFNKECGIFQIGEVFNGNEKYVHSYQGPLTSTFNYPLYFHIGDAFKDRDLKILDDYYSRQRPVFQEGNFTEVLGVFIGNHDNARFLYNNQRTKEQLDMASVFSIFWEGIPVIYYGDEQYLSGGPDPGCREALWDLNPAYNTESLLYKYYKTGLFYRKNLSLWEKDLEQLVCEKSQYAFRRGDDVLTVISLAEGDYNVDIPLDKIKEGKYCNIFRKNDCFDRATTVTIKISKEPKVYIPEDSLVEGYYIFE
jgi:alpha-amylase